MKTSEIAELVGGELHGEGEIEISSVADISDAASGQLVFLNKARDFQPTNASCIIVSSDFVHSKAETRSTGIVPVITVANPKLAFARVAAILHPPKLRKAEIHQSAVIAATAQIGRDVFIGAFACVGEGSRICDGTQLRARSKVGDNVIVGSSCVLDTNVFVEDNCIVGNRVILHSGVVVGTDGFGYVRDENGEYVKFPQIGKVVIEDNVEIGANSCIDRGALGETRIGEGTKIDNLVQVGHNVQVGKRCIIAAQTGISGSVVIEDDCVIGGQVGFGDHARVQSGAIIGSQAGVLPGKIVRPGVWWGTPIQPLDEYKRHYAHLKGIGRLKDEIKVLTARIRQLESEENR